MIDRCVGARARARCVALLAVLIVPLLSLAPLSMARADYVQGETPFFSGVPLQSLQSGAPVSSINSTQLVWGTSLSVHALSLGSAGTLNIRLEDIRWFEELKELSVLVTDLDSIWERLDGSGESALSIHAPVTLYVAVFAKSERKTDPGLYRLNANLAPVPLPAAVWLMLSALGGLGLLRKQA